MAGNCFVCDYQGFGKFEIDVEIVMTVHDHEYKYLVDGLTAHHILSHGYLPCQDFIDSVMFGKQTDRAIKVHIVPGETPEDYLDWYAVKGYTPIGYLRSDYSMGKTPDGFVGRLKKIMEFAEDEVDVIDGDDGQG